MEEASSIAKAIETAWNRAGQPTEFSIKVLELPQTSFFGLKTSKSAKVAFFFNEATVTVKAKDSGSRPENTERSAHYRQGQQRPITLRQPGSKPESDHAKVTDRHEQSRRRHEGREETRASREQKDQRHEQRNRPHRTDSYNRQDAQGATSVPRRGDRSADRRPRHESSSEQGYAQERETWTPEMVQIAQEWIKETLILMGKPDITVNTQVSHNYLKINLSNPVLDDARQEETQLKSWGMLAMEAVREKVGKPLRSLRIVLESPRR